jgi:hypothetical protein
LVAGHRPSASGHFMPVHSLWLRALLYCGFLCFLLRRCPIYFSTYKGRRGGNRLRPSGIPRNPA